MRAPAALSTSGLLFQAEQNHADAVIDAMAEELVGRIEQFTKMSP